MGRDLEHIQEHTVNPSNPGKILFTGKEYSEKGAREVALPVTSQLFMPVRLIAKTCCIRKSLLRRNKHFRRERWLGVLMKSITARHKILAPLTTGGRSKAKKRAKRKMFLLSLGWITSASRYLQWKSIYGRTSDFLCFTFRHQGERSKSPGV